ncbi:hypothetical protein I9Y33_001355 [Clostridium perfringens]|nr:hypothetical protein [Clostridium perfringens]
MASLFLYKKKDETSIFDLIYFKNGKLDLEKVKDLLDKNKAEYDDKKVFNKEGYTQTIIDSEKGLLSSTYIFRNILGQYTTIEFDEKSEGLKVIRSPYIYFGQSRLLIKDNVNILVKANYSNEEKVKGECISFFQEVGIEIEPVKFDNNLFQHIKNNYTWKKIKIQKIEREKDSTKNISYEVDPSSDKESEVDKIYSECGVYDSIAFTIPYEQSLYNVKMYKVGRKITVEESQFATKELFEEFCLYLMNEIMAIINNVSELGENDININEGEE